MTFLTRSFFSELPFMAGMRRSVVSALRWADLANAPGADSILVTAPPQQVSCGIAEVNMENRHPLRSAVAVV